MSKFNFQTVKNNIEQVKRELPALMANDAQRYFLGAFNNEGWDGKKWMEVQRRIPGTPEYKYAKPKSGRVKKILIGTGRLRREVSLLAGNAKVSYQKYNFTVTLAINEGTVPYAKIQNDGETIEKRNSSVIIHFDKTGKVVKRESKKANYAQKANVKDHDIKIPQRQFMGGSPALTAILRKRVENYMSKVWQG